MTYPANSESVAQDQLRAFVERIERLEEEQRGINDDKSEVYKEARGNGFDVKVLRKLIADRRKDPETRNEFQALYDLYWDALHGVVRAHVENIEEFPPETAEQSAGASQERAQTATGVGTEGDHLAPASRSTATAKTDVPTHQSQASGGGQSQHNSGVRVEPAEPSNITPIRKQWKHSDPAHPDCRNPGQCGGFSNMALCLPCTQAAEAGQVA